MVSRYEFLADTYETEIEKVLSVWSMFDDTDLHVRPRAGDRRGRSFLEHMVHQCQSEAGWFEKMFEIEVREGVLPETESQQAFLAHYAAAGSQRLSALRSKVDGWWEQPASFFGEPRPRTWIMVRRISHTSHHRGQQTALLRQLGRDLHSTYGPTADTGGLAKDKPPVIYPYPDVATLLREESAARAKAPLPTPVDRDVTERP